MCVCKCENVNGCVKMCDRMTWQSLEVRRCLYASDDIIFVKVDNLHESKEGQGWSRGGLVHIDVMIFVGERMGGYLFG